MDLYISLIILTLVVMTAIGIVKAIGFLFHWFES
jgi:hypothetical protein